jgi:hypothetical protein
LQPNDTDTEPWSKHLTRLTFKLCASDECDPSELEAQEAWVSRISSKLHQLQHMELEWAFQVDKVYGSFSAPLPFTGFNNLRVLHLRPALNSTVRLGPAAAQRLLGMVRPLQQLRELSLEFELEELAGSSGEEGEQQQQVAALGAAWKQQLLHLVLLKTLAGEVRLPE